MTNNPKLKVGLVFDDSLDSNDGVAQYVKVVGAWLSSQGHSVSYLVGQTTMPEWSGGKVYSLARNIKVKFNSNRLSMPLPASKKRIKQLLDQEKFDVLHIQVPYSPFMAQKIIKAAGSQTAIIGTFHIFPSGGLATWGSRLLAIVCSRSLKRFDQIVSVSSAASSFAKQTFGLDTQVLPNAVDISRFAGRTSQSATTKHIVFLGRLVKRKGCAELLKAFAVAQRTMPDLRLIIAGDGADRPKLEKYVQRNDLGDKVEFLGFIDEKAKPKLLASADIACFPSLYGESFGIVLIEAMAAGAGLVLGGDNPGYHSVLGAKPILLVDPADTNAFSERIIKLLNDKRLANELHKWQTSEVKQYDVNVVGDKILALYQETIARKLKKSHNDEYAIPKGNG